MSVGLWTNVHSNLSPPGSDVTQVKGDVTYYHYGCDGTDDRGWGCGYRTLQTMCAWVIHQRTRTDDKISVVPSLKTIQEALVAMGDKAASFVGSREWIGSFEVSICMDYLLEVPCKIIHVTSGALLYDHIEALKKHFVIVGAPVMMGGDGDNASKGILGVCCDPPSLLILDPHHYGKVTSLTDLYDRGMVSWRPLETFMKDSFYNLCLPQYQHS
ncbi:ufm1-specific protease 1-like [Mizuhopecten yessoensis]|uniref:Ufm1-specific protease 1 n=1 Tax=Mizuhopecten yessoensis TaxID=6573 RepID=A0A210QD51_MIZYE|nr:ufm1-specific protease 1-like [Mizuhopecten yessoensis]OWF46642.1 Ufm1-specific protease 1 [Mizuhopecten yessoensis]